MKLTGEGRELNLRWTARNDNSLDADDLLDCSRKRTSIEGSGLFSTIPKLPSLSTMEVWKVEAGLLSRVCATDKADEVVIVDARLPWEAMVMAESRRLGLDPSDILAPEKSPLVGEPSVIAVGEVAGVSGEADDLGEPDVPSFVEFLRRFARHNCSLPLYSRL